MERTVPNVQFASGSYTAGIIVEGPITERPDFESVLDMAFGLWCLIVAIAICSVNSLTEPGARRGEEFMQTARVPLPPYRLSDSTVTLTITFTTDTEGLDEVNVMGQVLPLLSRLARLVLDVIAEEKTQQESFASLFGGPSPHSSHWPGGLMIVDLWFIDEGLTLDPFPYGRRRRWPYGGSRY